VWFRSIKSAVKMHALLDLRGNIPSFIHVSDGKLHDVSVLGLMIWKPMATYVMGRGYLDFERFFDLHEAGALFVTRAILNTDLRRVYLAPNDRTYGVICDLAVELSGFYSHKNYRYHMRRIRFKGTQTGKTLIFLINLFGPPATTICELHKTRYQLELFLK
jgi:hypothetical protein